jgi:hypothetical protein
MQSKKITGTPASTPTVVGLDKAFDGSPETACSITQPTDNNPVVIDIAFDMPKTVNQIAMTCEDIKGYRLDAWIDGKWKLISLGRSWNVTVPQFTTNKVRISILPRMFQKETASISEIALYHNPSSTQ